MGIQCPNGGVAYGLGNRYRMAAHLTLIANQQPYILKGVVGADMSLDQDYTIDFANGTTYMVTMVLSTNRIIYVPATGNSVSERLWLRFAHTSTTGLDTIEVKETPTNTLIASVGIGTPINEGLCIEWDSTTWRSLKWTANITVAQ